MVGLCHDLNDQLAAVSAYVFLLKRRDLLGDMDGPIQERMNEMARGVQHVRSLCRDLMPRPTPVALTLLAESLSDILRSHPEGPIRCNAVDVDGQGAGVVRCEWASALRSLLISAVWVRRGVPQEETVDLELTAGSAANSVVVSLPGSFDPPPDEPLEADPYARGIELAIAGPRSVQVTLPTEGSR